MLLSLTSPTVQTPLILLAYVTSPTADKSYHSNSTRSLGLRNLVLAPVLLYIRAHAYCTIYSFHACCTFMQWGVPRIVA